MSLNTDSNRSEPQRLWRSRENRTAGCRRDKNHTEQKRTTERENKNKCFRLAGYIPLGHKQPWNYTYVSIYVEPTALRWRSRAPGAKSTQHLNQLHLHRCDGGGGGSRRVWGISTTQGGKGSDTNTRQRVSVMPMHRPDWSGTQIW